MKSLLLSLLLPISLFAQISPASLVNPFIGTGGHGHTFPGATTPFGMVQLSPDTRIDGSWDGCGGYHYSDSIIYGFSHTHLSGTGVSDYGDIMVMPMNLENASADRLIYQSKYGHNKEKAGAGWYEVYLEKHKIKAELTASTRVGFHRYTFEGKNAAIVLDLKHRDELLEGKIEQVDSYRIRGMRRSKAWATDQVIYYEMVFSQKINNIKGESNNKEGDLNAIVEFENMSTNRLEVKVGLSFASQEGAHLNLETESKAISFDQAKEKAIVNWNTELNRIQVQGGTDEQKHIFYTALYHTMIQPNTANDVDGRYRGMDMKIHEADHTVYTVFSLWDTFRSAHPLYAILYPERQNDFIKTFLLMYKQGGRLPVWELAANETDCMIGYHSVSVITDSWFKGIKDFDKDLALEAMVKSAKWNHFGLPDYIKYGALSIDDESESVSKTLEYAYDDWCIARFAEDIGNSEVAAEFYKRAQSWKNLFDSSTGFMRPKKNGAWLEPFEPREVNNHFTEANSWQYSFFVPHDIYGLAEMHGGRAALISKLDLLFNANSITTGRDQSDITGLIGQYAHGNEPSHHMAWLYNELGEPEKAQKRIYQIIDEMYNDAPDGLSGNEDCGQMSAWYVFSTMGFYPICPGLPTYSLIQPIFSKVEITPVGGKPFTINNPTPNRDEFLSTKNGKPDYWFNHSEILKGNTLNLINSSEILEFTAIDPSPFELYPKEKILQAPVFSATTMVFRDSLKVEILKPNQEVELLYSNSKDADLKTYKPISDKLTVSKREDYFVIAKDKSGKTSLPAKASYYPIPNEFSIEIKSVYSPQYTAGGDAGIIDGFYADEDWRKGGWQGYQGQDFECIIDMKKPDLITSINASFLQDTRSWILLPTEVEFFTSLNGKDWMVFGNVSPTVSANDFNSQRWSAVFNSGRDDGKPEPMFMPYPVSARYVKVKAKNFGALPNWHQGAGGDAFIFIDEITIK